MAYWNTRMSQSLVAGSVLKGAHHHTVWLPSCCPSPGQPDLGQVGSSTPVVAVNLNLRRCHKRRNRWRWFSRQLQISLTNMQKPTLWKIGANTAQKVFTIPIYDLIVLLKLVFRFLPLPFLPIQSLTLWLTLNPTSSMQPSLICFPPAGSYLFLPGISTSPF